MRLLSVYIIYVYLSVCECEKRKCKYVKTEHPQASRNIIGSLTTREILTTTTTVVKDNAKFNTLDIYGADRDQAHGRQDTTEDFATVSKSVESSCGLELKPYTGKSKYAVKYIFIMFYLHHK